MSKSTVALVLCDVVSHGLKAGAVVEASPDLIKALTADGSVDPNKEAVAYARSQGAATARSSIELAAEMRESDRKALLAEIAKAEQALKSATADEVKAALQADIDVKRAALAEIDA